MAGLVTAGVVAFLLSGLEFPTALNAVPTVAKKTNPAIVPIKTSPDKRVVLKKKPTNLAQVVLPTTAPKKLKPKKRVAKKKKIVKPKKRIAKIKKRSKSARIMPTIQPASLIVSFPKPTNNTIVVSKAPKYVKISHVDGELHESASSWDCVEDKSSGLVWERKTEDRGLRDAGNFYSWYDPNELSNGGHVGAADNGKCRGGISCDTNAYVKAVNALKLCGFSDWRLPTRTDLMTLVQYSKKSKGKGLINRHFFPTASSDWYWAMDSDNLNPARAWYVLFFNGRYLKASKSEAKRIRLVRTRSERSMQNMAKKSMSIAIK